MAKSPPPDDLLAVALDVFREHLLAEIPAAKKYQALMVANAMAISARQHQRDGVDDLPPAFVAELRELLEGDVVETEVVQTLIRRLREGNFRAGSPQSKALHRLLLDDARRRLAISNPRYLAASKP